MQKRSPVLHISFLRLEVSQFEILKKVTKNLLLFLTLMSIKTIVLQDFFLLADLYFKISRKDNF